jgi:hypothetical protein
MTQAEESAWAIVGEEKMTQSKNRAYVCTYVGNAIVNLQNSCD